MKPIETAPTDGTHILLYGVNEDDFGNVWEESLGWCEGFMVSTDGWYNIVGHPSHPTHWMELPGSPKSV